MLVLTRKKNESLIINNDVELTVLEIRGDHVRIGIKAPPEVKIYRSEVWDAIKKTNITSRGVTDEVLEEFSVKLQPKKKK